MHACMRAPLAHARLPRLSVQAAEGNYRDDITAIVVFLPIFEGKMEAQGQAVAAKGEKHTFVHDADDRGGLSPVDATAAGIGRARQGAVAPGSTEARRARQRQNEGRRLRVFGAAAA